MSSTSSLEQLAAFALCFAAGVVSTLALAAYTKVLKAKKSSAN